MPYNHPVNYEDILNGILSLQDAVAIGFDRGHADLENGLDQVRAEMATGFAQVRSEMATGFAHVRAEILDVRNDVSRLEQRVSRRR